MASWKYDRDQQHHNMDPVGYDADTQVYTYYDASTGRYYDTDQGRYGNLTHTHTANSGTAPQSGFNGEGPPAESVEHDWKMMKPFFLLIAVVLMTLLWYVNSAGTSTPPPEIQCGTGFEKYGILRGDTCWDIAQARKTSVEKLVEANEGIVCDKLILGKVICVPVEE